jgi:hypothetical protein
MPALEDYVVEIDPLPMTTLVQNSGVRNSDDTHAQISERMCRGKFVASKRQREDDMKRVLNEQNCLLKEQKDIIELMKDNQALRDTLHQKEVDALIALAARATSAPGEVDVLTDHAARASIAHGKVDALTDSAFIPRGEADAVAQISNTFFAAPSGASSVGISTNSLEVSTIGRATSEVPDSLDPVHRSRKALERLNVRHFSHVDVDVAKILPNAIAMCTLSMQTMHSTTETFGPDVSQKRECEMQTNGIRKSETWAIPMVHHPRGRPQQRRIEALNKPLDRCSTTTRLNHYPLTPTIRKWMMTITMQKRIHQSEFETLPQSHMVMRRFPRMTCGSCWVSANNTMNATMLTTWRLQSLSTRRSLRL